MIADLTFGRPDALGVRTARFVPCSSVPLGAACLVANGLREMLRELFGERCEVSIGEPAAIDPAAWDVLARDAHAFYTPGRQTDIVLVVSQPHARALVRRAFGEGEPNAGAPLSTLELEAMERIAARCAAAFDPLCAERRGSTARVDPAAISACVAYFDVRVRTPVSIVFGIGILRELPDPGPARTLGPAQLRSVPLAGSVEFAAGSIDLAAFLALEPGSLIPLETQVGARASLKFGGSDYAVGNAGARGGRYSFEVQSVRRPMGAGS